MRGSLTGNRQDLSRGLDDYEEIPGLTKELRTENAKNEAAPVVHLISSSSSSGDSGSDSDSEPVLIGISRPYHRTSGTKSHQPSICEHSSPGLAAPSYNSRDLVRAIDSEDILRMTLARDITSLQKIQSTLDQALRSDRVQKTNSRRPSSSGMDTTSESEDDSTLVNRSRAPSASSESVKRRKISHDRPKQNHSGRDYSTCVDRRSSIVVDVKGRGKARATPRVLPSKSRKSFKTIPPSACTLPQARLNRSRRVLSPGSIFGIEYPLTTVSMKGDVQFIHRKDQKWFGAFSLPNSENVPYNVEDACVVDDLVVIAYNKGPHRLSTIRIPDTSSDSRPTISYSNCGSSSSSSSAATSSGIRALAAVSSFSTFKGKTAITAGEDRIIQLWSLEGTPHDSEESDSDSDDASSSNGGAATSHTISAAVSSKLGILPHKVTALAVRGTSLFSSRNKVLSVNDVHGKGWNTSSGSSRRRGASDDLANEILHIHAPLGAGNQNLVFVETDHPRTQIGLYDVRKDIRTEGEDILFGHAPNSSDSSSSRNRTIKYYKGSPDTSSETYKYVRGYSDGVVCLFDWRNTKAPVQQTSARRNSGKEIYHTIFADFSIPLPGSNKNNNRTTKGVVTFGGAELDFLDLELNTLRKS
ncbi:hypothetical protein GYMLUDRAFT_100877 [Collybiopsis luxurians FD-317 M1]|uniref:WD40 repeat-like protein n=1 Tax=Collybiopsis luxurians FD-317 M1 TaxID=944289 RepID=A0A0D0C2B5_9AGAR|nr:hypothetical protein GYMLUDRAFT_100877 [Collybiopsis luxurians FD-317 M1]